LRLDVPSALGSAIVAFTELLAVIALFWAYAHSFRLIFGKNLGGVRIRLQTNSSTFVAPTPLLIRKIRKAWTRRSRRWGKLGFLFVLIVFEYYVVTKWLKVAKSSDDAYGLVTWLVLGALLYGLPLGWFFGSVLELKSIFKEDFGEFRVYLTSQPTQLASPRFLAELERLARELFS
jgi:hypothetical protein